LFLGSGPLSPTDGNVGCGGGPASYEGGRVLSRFPVNAAVNVLVSASVQGINRDSLTHGLGQIGNAVGNYLRFNITSTDDPNPIPAGNQVSIATLSDADTLSVCGLAVVDGKDHGGCALPLYDHQFGLLLSFRAVMAARQTARGYIHEISHALLGMCHIDGNT